MESALAKYVLDILEKPSFPPKFLTTFHVASVNRLTRKVYVAYDTRQWNAVGGKCVYLLHACAHATLRLRILPPTPDLSLTRTHFNRAARFIAHLNGARSINYVARDVEAINPGQSAAYYAGGLQGEGRFMEGPRGDKLRVVGHL
jgi:hypothetical protein